ncbi:DMT family transporter [Lacihabitans sp. LS3-19]|uniref:DMT family transporter n=1 Tax=Lacihabitans sp. LS3-19 TaxID=2487335 RepID=UPI0020CF491C|nr:DMT family transporter [Lacihabitans sp. LS3-19]MCP9768415.1 DMT family transporter [Lacihabitans sp. LS3-19]
MFYLALSILFSVLLLVNFRIFPKFEISTFQAIAFNYPVCFITGILLMPDGQHFALDFTQNWTYYCLALGVGFIITFVLSGLATQKIGMTLTSMANNVSLVIPVLFSLLVFGSAGKVFDWINYLGLVLAILAVAIATFKADSGKKANFWLQGGLALAVFLMYGITNTTINYLNIEVIRDAERVVPVTLVMVLGAVLAGFLMLVYRLIKGTEKIEMKNVLAGITLGVPNFLSFYLIILTLGYFGNSGAFVYPIYNMGVILVSALVSVLFFKEKISNLNRIGLLLALVAILMISWQEVFGL